MNALDKIGPAVDHLTDTADSLAQLSDELGKALDIFAKASDTAGEVLDRLGEASDERINRGSIYAKKDCAGGLVGRLDLGTIITCERYGSVESIGGDYVGGVAGSASALRENRAIVSILSGGEYVGAIAGAAELASNDVKGNCFLYTGVEGIDGISYLGCAQRISFEELRAVPGIPNELCTFTLTLQAEDKIVKVLNFTYGEGLSALILPDVPEKEGYYGRWPEFDTTGRNSDLVLDAVYPSWVTMTHRQWTIPLLNHEGDRRRLLYPSRRNEFSYLEIHHNCR